MSVQAAMVGIKQANAALVTLIGVRFYENALPQEPTLPAAKFQIISSPKQHVMGPSIANHHPRIQIDGYVQSVRSGGSTAISTLRNALVTAFYGYAGTIGGIVVKACLLDSESNDIEMLSDSIEMDHVQLDFMVDHE